MRTCSSYANVGEGCYFADPEGRWRGQHFGTADVDFDTGDDSEGEWIILTHAHNGEEFVIRVDGEEVGRKTHELDLRSNRDVQIGRWDRTDDQRKWYFDGSVAETIVFDRSLEHAEVTAVERYMRSTFGIGLDGT